MVESEDFNPAELMQSTTDLREALGVYLDENRMTLTEEKLSLHERQLSACQNILDALHSQAPKEVIFKLIDDFSDLGELPPGLAPEDIEDCKVI